MPESPCWPRNTLKDYLNGSADDQRLEAIESHLAECPSCEQTVFELESNPDTLFMALREQFGELQSHASQANSELESEPSVIQRVLESVKQLPGGAGAPARPLDKSAQIGVQQIGAYELLQTLGRGGMGLVMLARHATLKKQVAIKILPSLIGDRPELVQRFQREIITAGQLSHPSIVHATDAGAEQGTHYLVMEYIDGLDLSRLARLGSPLSIADACEMIRQAALGLSYAHAQGVVHRDVKPSNLMLDTAGRVKILDFGLAQLNLWEDAAVELTTVGQLMGTLDYMAPEQAERVGPVDYRADLYALGATLFRLLTGRAPLAASPNMTLLEKVRMLGSQSAPLVSTLRDDCPVALVQLIEQLLSRDPAARPASAAHVAEALLPFCTGHDLVTLLTRCRQRATEDVAGLESLRTQSLRVREPHTEPPRKPPRLRNWLILAGLSPLAILAGIMIVLDMQKGQLVIESDVAGIKVNLLQDGKIYERLEVETGAQATRLFADKYAIAIDGASDTVALDQSTIEIRRGATVVAKITQKAASKVTPSQPAGAASTLTPQSESAPLDRGPSELKSHVLQGSDPELAFRVLSQRFASEPDIRMELDKATNKIIVQARPTIHQEIEQLLRMLSGQDNDFEVIDLKMDTQLAMATIEKFFGLTKSGTPDPSQPIIDGDLTQRRLYVKGNRKQIDQIKALISKIETLSPSNNDSPAAGPLGTPGTGTEHSVELLQNYASAAAPVSSPGTGTVPTPTPTYAGRALKDWLEVLERDLDTKTRLDTLPAIERLAGTADTETRERINRALVNSIATVAQGMQWSQDGHRLFPEDDSGLTALLKSLMSINDDEAAFKLLQEGCLLHAGRVNLSTIAILVNLWPYDCHRIAGDWLLSDGRFQSLDAPEAWAAFAFHQNLLRYRDADYFRELPKAILQHPQLGLPALLLLDPPMSNEEQIKFLARPEAIQLEETVARNAREAFLSDASSPQLVAMSAHWLARTTANLDEHRAELIEKIRSRMQQLATDDERLLAVVTEVVASVPAKTKVMISSRRDQRGRGQSHAVIQGAINAFSLNASNSERMTFVYGYARSELVSMLALSVRLNAVRELDDCLSPMAERVFANASPAMAAYTQSGHESVDVFHWPFDDDQVRRMPAPCNTVPPAAWRAAKLARTIQELANVPLFNTQLYHLMLGDNAQGIIMGRDKNGDGQLSKAEASDYFSWGADFNEDKLISKEELIEHSLAGVKSEYIRRRFGDLAISRSSSLTTQQVAPAISQSQFEEMDANKDDRLTQDELITYGMSHPQPPLSQLFVLDCTVSDINSEYRAWAARQITKYDKNKDGQLTADEWNAMITKPKEGTDANGDGVITLEEFAKKR